MKHINIYLILLLFVIIACEKDDNPVIVEEDNIQEKIDHLLAEEFNNYLSKYPDYPGGYALHVRYKDSDYFTTQGFEGEVTERHHFRAQSNTKTFTAAAILLLHQRNQLNVRHTLTDIMPGTSDPYFPNNDNFNIPDKEKIRIWDLLQHRAGIFDLNGQPMPDTLKNNPEYINQEYVEYLRNTKPNYTVSAEELISVLSKHQLSNFLPGEAWSYSNTGYTILVYIIERVAGKSFKEFVTEEFVIPLDLEDTTFPDQGTDQFLPEPYVSGYAALPEGTLNLTEANMSASVGEGNVISSTKDLCTFFRELLNGSSNLSSLLVNNYMKDCKPVSDIGNRSYGAGLFNYYELGFGHGGDGDGYSSKVFYDPNIDLTIVCFHNCYNVLSGSASLAEQETQMLDFCYRVKRIIISN